MYIANLQILSLRFRYRDITIYKYGTVINPQVSKILLYLSFTVTGMSLTSTPDL